MERILKYRWHNLHKHPNDLPKRADRVLINKSFFSGEYIPYMDVADFDLKDGKFYRTHSDKAYRSEEIYGWKYIKPMKKGGWKKWTGLIEDKDGYVILR